MCYCISLPRISPADWSLFSPQIQCGWSDWDSLSCWCVCACTPEMSQCFYLCERAMDRGRNTWVRGAVVCACHIACTYCTVYGFRPRVCVSSRSLGRLAWTRWEEMRGGRRRLGRRSEAHLMPVCIDSVWHLSARDTHPVWRAEILWHCVCECVCVEVAVPVAKLTAYELIFFFLFFPFPFALLCHLIRVLFSFFTGPAAKLWSIFISTSLSPPSFLPSPLPTPSLTIITSATCVLMTRWTPSQDVLNQVIGSRTWVPLHARRFSRQNDFYLPVKLLRK